MKANLFLLLLAAVTLAPARQKDSDLDRYSDQAQQALASKDWETARGALEHLAQLAPAVAQVHANLGLAYYFEGRSSDALASFQRARKLNPQLPQINAMIGVSEAELGRCSEAVKLLGSAFDHPSDHDADRLTGLHLVRCYSELKQPEKALITGEILLNRYPSDPEILYNISRLHAERSSDLMSALQRTAPDSAWMHFANAQVQEDLDRTETAAQEYRNALAKDPHLVGAHYRLGRLLLRGSRTPETLARAKNEFEQELAIAPRNADAEYELGEISREQGDPASALAHFQRAIQYHPEFVEARLAAAKALLEQGHAADALPHLKEAARLDPRNKAAHYLLASAYKNLGDSDHSAAEFAAYKSLGAGSSSAVSQTSTEDHN